LRRVLVAGTYNCHPVAMAATLATLKTLADAKANVYGRLEQLAQQLEEGQRRLFHDFRITATINRVGSAHCVYFMERAPDNWWDIITKHDFEFDTRYRRALIERGIYYFPVTVKQGSISAAHTIDDIEQTLDATKSALRNLKS
jgi:glutamate-1-semialdehyde 2,1-aminomutase